MPTVSANSQPSTQSPAQSHFKAQTLAAYQDWISRHDWDVFGTLNFVPNRKPHIDTAQKQWSYFWNKVDRLAYGQTGVQSGARVERVVCNQFGSLGENPHIHFLAKSPINTDDFCVYLNALWAATSPEAAPPNSNEIYPVLKVNRASGYSLHEYWKLGSETFNDRLTCLNTDKTPPKPRLDAADRLKIAGKEIWLTRARLALPNHIENAQARYNKRHAH